MTLAQKYYKECVFPNLCQTFSHDAEPAHNWAMEKLRFLERHPAFCRLVSSRLCFSDPRLKVSAFGLDFKHPLGLAAGFDKHCEVYARAIPAFGWSSCDIGAITMHSQEGTLPTDPDWPRLRRDPVSSSVWNKMGFNNPGASAASEKMSGRTASIPIGVNIGKSAITPIKHAAADYCYTIRTLWPRVDYLILNVSSPNTNQLRSLQRQDDLVSLLREAEEQNRITGFAITGRTNQRKPLGLKVSPDLSEEEIEDVVTACNLAGCVDFIETTNTTLSRPKGLSWVIPQAGGLSGPYLRPLALRTLDLFFQKLREEKLGIDLVGTGGIGSGMDLFERILHGARVARVYSAWIFEGPDFVKRTLVDLLMLMKCFNFQSVEQMVGLWHRLSEEEREGLFSKPLSSAFSSLHS